LRAATVTLRPLRNGDVEDLVAILARPGVREWWSPLDDAEHTTDGLHNEGAAFAIEVGSALAGWLGYSEEADPDYLHASLDIFLAPECQGRRLGRTALLLAADWLFDQRGHHRLTIDPACSNARAIRAYEAVGFRPVGTMRRYERGADGSWHDNLLMDLLREEFRREDQSGESVAVVSDLAIRSAAEQDIERVLPLWEAAGSSPSVTDSETGLRALLAFNSCALLVAARAAGWSGH
jgi:aminoglycoside 6'-N-acetyltransferase